MDVGGGWQVKKNPKNVSPAWCPPGLTRDGVQGLHGPREPSCRHTRAHERPQVSGTTGRWRISRKRRPNVYVCVEVDDEKLTREAELQFCDAGVRETSGVCRASCQGWKRHLARGSWRLH